MAFRLPSSQWGATGGRPRPPVPIGRRALAAKPAASGTQRPKIRIALPEIVDFDDTIRPARPLAGHWQSVRAACPAPLSRAGAATRNSRMEPGLKYRPELDGLRAFAVVPVILF